LGTAGDGLAPLKQAMADLLVLLRKQAQLSQQELADRMAYARVTVASAETSHRQPSEAFWIAADNSLGAGGQLLRAYAQLAAARDDQKRIAAGRDRARRAAGATFSFAPDEPAWPRDSGASSAEPATVVGSVGGSPPRASTRTPDGSSPRVDSADWPQAAAIVQPAADRPGRRRSAPGSVPLEEALEHLRRYWHVLVAADNLFGPAHALGAVHAQLALIEGLMPDSAGSTRRALLGLGAQYAESAGWLWEDAGRLEQAAVWTNRALEWAHAAGDAQLVAWALFRRSQQTAADRDTARTLGLVEAARRTTDGLPGPMRAALAQQAALGLAMDGDEHGCHNRLDEALDFAAADDVRGDASHGHGSFCTASYIEIESKPSSTKSASTDAATSNPRSAYQPAQPSSPGREFAK
jgi:hypothetical protein